MLIDAKKLQPGAEIRADICIIGSGPAGLAIAMDYDGLPLTVAVLEAGGVAEDPESQSLSEIAAGSRFGNTDAVVSSRCVGGNSNAWSILTNGLDRNVRLIPMSAADFESRDWMDECGWPVGLDYLAPYYARAQAFFGLPPRGFEPEAWSDEDHQPLELNPERVKTVMFQFADGNVVRDRAAKAVCASKNVTIYTYAAAHELILAEDGRTVASVRCATDPGRQITVRADQVILAAGGLWNAQLLLASDRQIKGGLGNRGDHVGRHFADHPLLQGGRFHPASRDLFERMKLYDMRPVNGVSCMGHLQIAETALRTERVFNAAALFLPAEKDADKHRALSPRQERAFKAAINLRFALRNRSLPELGDFVDVLAGIDGPAKRLADRVLRPKAHLSRGGWSDLPNLERRFDYFDVFHISEQAPHHDSRVVLSGERDRLGQRKVRVEWTYHDADKAAIMRTLELFADELAKAGLGRYEIFRANDGGPVVLHSSANHFIGLTRMSERAEDGVVDVDCRVHGTRNLYVASSSVFPSAGFANPTLSIVALAHRVGDTALGAWMQSHPEAANDMPKVATVAGRVA